MEMIDLYDVVIWDGEPFGKYRHQKEEAEIKKIDKARINYYNHHTGRKWGEHVNYHLAMDSGYLEVDDIADIIIKYAELKIDRLASFNW